jgi:hypothetical protein
MQKTELIVLLLFAVILASWAGLPEGRAHLDLFGQTLGCDGRLQLDSDEAVIVGGAVNFHFVNEGTESITLRSTAPWLVREAGTDGPVVYAPVSAAVLQEVPPISRYPTSEAWSWTPDREGDYYIELAYECASAYPLLTHLRVTVSPEDIREFSGSVALVAILGIGATLLVARYQCARSRLLHIVGE